MSSDKNEKNRKFEAAAAKLNDVMLAAAEQVIRAAKLLRDSPADLEATMLINQFPPEVLDGLKEIADFHPRSLTPEQFQRVFSIGMAMGSYLKATPAK